MKRQAIGLSTSLKEGQELLLMSEKEKKKLLRTLQDGPPKPGLRNVFEAILTYGHDEDFVPYLDPDFDKTQAAAGSREKLDVMADRVLRGEPLWHEEDRADYSGLTGAVRPRD